MALNFLFAEYLDTEGCLCLRLEDNGNVSAPLEYRNIDAIKAMQADAETIVVLSTMVSSLHQVELPWLNENKARVAIPFALEEQLASKITTLHFAFDRAHHQNNHYLVAVIDKAYLIDIMTRLDEAGIEFNEITLDFFALKPEEVSVTPSMVLARVEGYQGALSFELAPTYLKSVTENATIFSYEDTPTEWTQTVSTSVDGPFLIWVARRLQQTLRLNLCQGELRHGKQQEGFSHRWALACLGAISLWLLSVLLINGVNLIRLNNQLNTVNKEIASEYQLFFPGAQRVISPRFRITQLLKTGHAGQSASTLWPLLDKLDNASNLKEVIVEQLEFKNQMLLVTLTGHDFNVLEEFAEQLRKAQIKVSQTHAVSHDNDVSSVMELRL